MNKRVEMMSDSKARKDERRTIKSGADKILGKVETMRKALDRQVEILKEQVGQLRSVLGDAQTG
jgi:hypothetical protein